MSGLVYLDAMASTPVDPQVVAAMAPYWSEAFANPHSIDHAAGWRAADAIEGAAASIARLIGAEPDEIVFTAGATEANNLALLGLAGRAPPNRRRILVSAIEHKSVLSAARAAAARHCLNCDIVPVDAHGSIDPELLANMLSDDVLCVAAMAVNNEIGTIQDLAGISAACERVGAHFLCDAVQAPFALDIDVARDGMATLSLSAHKIYGPKGIGALYVRRDVQGEIEPQIHGGQQQSGLRAGTLPTPLCVGFGAAAEILLTGYPGVAQERFLLSVVRKGFEAGIEKLGHPIRINGEGGRRHPGNCNVSFVGCDGRELLQLLQPMVAASSGSACSSGIVEPSHVLRAIGLTAEEADSSVRFSFGRFTTEDEVAFALRAIGQVLDETVATAAA
jgi:cysteine desulfurase